MNIYLRDYKHSSCETRWPDTLKTAFGDGKVDVSGHKDTINDFPLASLVFVHTDDPKVKVGWSQKLSNKNLMGLIFLKQNGVRGVPPTESKAHDCYWDIEQFTTHARPKLFCEQVSSGELFNINWTLLQPENSEALLAAQLICDAADNELDTHGISIHKPAGELLEKARAVIKAKEDGRSLENEITALNSALGVVRES